MILLAVVLEPFEIFAFGKGGEGEESGFEDGEHAGGVPAARCEAQQGGRRLHSGAVDNGPLFVGEKRHAHLPADSADLRSKACHVFR